VVDEDLDARKGVTARVEQRFDDGGRLLEKVETRVNAAGKVVGTRTRYSSDGAGQRSERVSPVE